MSDQKTFRTKAIVDIEKATVSVYGKFSDTDWFLRYLYQVNELEVIHIESLTTKVKHDHAENDGDHLVQ